MHPGKPYTPQQKGLIQLEAELYQIFFWFLEQDHHSTCTISENSEIIHAAQKITEKLRARAIENYSFQNATKAQKARKKLMERVKYIIETRTE